MQGPVYQHNHVNLPLTKLDLITKGKKKKGRKVCFDLLNNLLSDQSINQSVCPSICSSVCLSLCPSINQSTDLSVLGHVVMKSVGLFFLLQIDQ